MSDNMAPDELASRIRESPDHRRCDLSRLFADSEAFAAVVSILAEPFMVQRIDVVAAPDASGFALGGAVALQLRAGLVLVRKAGKAAWRTERQEFTDYTGERGALHLVSDAVAPGQRVLLVDDWAETGGQAFAALQLLERAGAVIVGAAFISVDARVREDPRFRSLLIHAVLDYDAHDCRR